MTALSNDDSPVYIRLRSTIAAGILRGDYKAGDQLPSVRALAVIGADGARSEVARQAVPGGGRFEERRRRTWPGLCVTQRAFYPVLARGR